ncbi:MAG: M48 family metalloprotease [bacterium]
MNLQNSLHTTALVLALGGVAALVGWLAAGSAGAVVAVGVMVVSVVVRHQGATQALLRQLGAARVPDHVAPGLARLLAVLSARAGLPVPRLFLVPLPVPQALAMGSADAPLVAVSPALLDRLTPRQVAAVLAHELSHLRHGDLRVMRLADAAVAVTGGLARLGLLAGIIALIAGAPMPFWVLLLLYLAPLGMVALRQALSRTREFAADAGAAHLTGDPAALADALEALERPHRARWWWQPMAPAAEPEDWLSSHPSTAERVRRLRLLAV